MRYGKIILECDDGIVFKISEETPNILVINVKKASKDEKSKKFDSSESKSHKNKK